LRAAQLALNELSRADPRQLHQETKVADPDYEIAARDYCRLSGNQPDSMVLYETPDGKPAGEYPLWQIIAETLRDLDLRIEAVEAAYAKAGG
jgi:hypothetical protein